MGRNKPSESLSSGVAKKISSSPIGDLDLAPFEEMGEGEPTDMELQDLTQAAIGALQSADAGFEKTYDGLVDRMESASEDLAGAIVDGNVPESFEFALDELRTGLANGMKNARDIPIGHATSFLQTLGEDPFSILPPAALGAAGREIGDQFRGEETPPPDDTRLGSAGSGPTGDQFKVES